MEQILRFRRTPFPARCSMTTQGDSVEKAMQQFSGDSMPMPVSRITVVAIAAMAEDHYWRATVRIDRDGNRQYDTMYLRIIDKDIKLDWEATVGYWSTPPKTYLALGSPSEGVVARVRASIGYHYFGQWRDKEHIVQHVRVFTRTGQSFDGYVPRSMPVYNELMQILVDGNSHDLTLRLRGAAGETDCPMITELLAHSWVLPPNDKKT